MKKDTDLLSSNHHRSYNPAYFAPLFATEDRHFWFKARNLVIETLMNQIIADLAPGYRILEVGCGTGNTLRVLQSVCKSGIVVGMDLFAEGLPYARQRTPCSLIQGDIHHAPFNTPFNCICLFDMLEHLPDDMQILHDLQSLLTLNGRLFLTVPAHPNLWSYFDEESHHFRRYQLAELRNKLLAAGYQIEYLTQYMLSIFPLVKLGRKLASLTNRSVQQRANLSSKQLTIRELQIVPIVNELLTWLLSQEVSLIKRRLPIPLGTSLLAIARKK